MKVSIQKLPESKIQLEIELPTEEFNKFIEKATQDLGKDLEIEGFRKGKVPKEIVEKEIGLAKILEEAVQLAIKENYPQAILENKIEVISQPEVEILKLAPGNPFIFRAKTQVLPEIKLADYKKIAFRIKKNEVLVEDKEVENALSWLQKSRAKFTLKSGPCQKGDWVEIEYFSKEIENERKINDAFILGEGHLISGFEENLLGMESGQEKEFPLIFPDNYLPKRSEGWRRADAPRLPKRSEGWRRADAPRPQKDIAGKKVNFKAKMKSVQKMELPEINDQFAKGLGKLENLDGLKKSLKEGLNLEKEMEESQRVREEILREISQNSEFQVPEILVIKEQERMLEFLKEEVSQKLGISFNDYLAKIKKSEKELLDSFLPEAREKVKNLLVLREISKKEKIDVSDEEIKEEINKILKNTDIKKAEGIDPHTKFGVGVDPEKLKDYTKEVLINEKTFKFLESLTQK
jgi:trigger factor